MIGAILVGIVDLLFHVDARLADRAAARRAREDEGRRRLRAELEALEAGKGVGSGAGGGPS